MAGGVAGLGVPLGGQVLQVLHDGVGGGEGEFPFDDSEVGLPQVAEDAPEVRAGVVPALAGVPGP